MGQQKNNVDITNVTLSHKSVEKCFPTLDIVRWVSTCIFLWSNQPLPSIPGLTIQGGKKEGGCLHAPWSMPACPGHALVVAIS